MKMSITTLEKRWARWGAIIGGVFWLIKGGAILLTGIQPPFIFEIAPLFFAIGLWGSYVSLAKADRSRLAQGGVIIAIAAAVSSLAWLLVELVAPYLIPQEDTFTIITPFIVLASFGVLIGALMIGIAAWRARVILQAQLLIMIPLGFLLAMASVILLEEIIDNPILTERLLELPIVALGIIWIWLGFVLASRLKVP